MQHDIERARDAAVAVQDVYTLSVAATQMPHFFVSQTWEVTDLRHETNPWSAVMTKSNLTWPAGITKSGHANVTGRLCLDSGLGPVSKRNGHLTVSPCGPNDGRSPVDPGQRWVLRPDASLRPFAHPHLCVTAHNYDGPRFNETAETPTLVKCDGRVSQKWAYHGSAPGDRGSGHLWFGDGADSLGIVNVTTTVA